MGATLSLLKCWWMNDLTNRSDWYIEKACKGFFRRTNQIEISQESVHFHMNEKTHKKTHSNGGLTVYMIYNTCVGSLFARRQSLGKTLVEVTFLWKIRKRITGKNIKLAETTPTLIEFFLSWVTWTNSTTKDAHLKMNNSVVYRPHGALSWQILSARTQWQCKSWVRKSINSITVYRVDFVWYRWTYASTKNPASERHFTETSGGNRARKSLQCSSVARPPAEQPVSKAWTKAMAMHGAFSLLIDEFIKTS